MLTKFDIASIDKLLDKKLDSKLKPLKDDVTQIRKDIKTIVNFFDKEYLELRERVERIEQHLNLPPVQ